MSNDAGKEVTALARVLPKKSAVELLREGFDRLQRKDLEVVQAMNRFADLPTKVEDPEGKEISRLLALPDEEIIRAGWKSRRELRMALYGTLPRSRWPASMQAAHERIGMRLRKQQVKTEKTSLNLNIINIPAPRPVEEQRIITIEAEDKPPF